MTDLKAADFHSPGFCADVRQRDAQNEDITQKPVMSITQNFLCPTQAGVDSQRILGC